MPVELDYEPNRTRPELGETIGREPRSPIPAVVTWIVVCLFLMLLLLLLIYWVFSK